MFQAQTRGEIKVKIGVIKVIINIYLPIIKQLSGRSRGGVRGAWATPYFWTKLRPNRPKKFFLGCSWLGWYRHHIIQCILHFVWFQIYWKKKTFNFLFQKAVKLLVTCHFQILLFPVRRLWLGAVVILCVAAKPHIAWLKHFEYLPFIRNWFCLARSLCSKYMSAFQSPYRGKWILSCQLINPNFSVSLFYKHSSTFFFLVVCIPFLSSLRQTKMLLRSL